MHHIDKNTTTINVNLQNTLVIRTKTVNLNKVKYFMLEENRRMKSIDTCGNHTIICCTFLRAGNTDLCFFVTLNIQESTENNTINTQMPSPSSVFCFRNF